MTLRLLWPIAGLAGWAGAFMLVYALHGIGCAGGWQHVPVGPTSLHRIVQAGSVVASLIALAVLAVWLHCRRAAALMRSGDLLLSMLTKASAWTGLAATALTLFPVFTTSVCR